MVLWQTEWEQYRGRGGGEGGRDTETQNKTLQHSVHNQAGNRTSYVRYNKPRARRGSTIAQPTSTGRTDRRRQDESMRLDCRPPNQHAHTSAGKSPLNQQHQTKKRVGAQNLRPRSQTSIPPYFYYAPTQSVRLTAKKVIFNVSEKTQQL